MVYRIYESLLPTLEKKLVRIRNKANKYNCDFSYTQVGEEFKEVRNEKGYLHTLRFVLIDVAGTAVINNWEFMAGIDHESTGNIIRNISNDSLPEYYRNCSPFCEHCKSDRYRKRTYVIRNTETKELKQVGSACLMDYTHGLSAELAAAMLEGLTSLESYQNYDSSYFSGGSFKRYWNVETLVPYIAECCKIFGYAKTDSQIPTRERVVDFYNVLYRGEHSVWTESAKEEIEKTGYNPDSEYAVTTAKNALKWIAEKESDSEYIHNLKTVCKMEYVEYQHLGILCSLISAYDRDMQWKAREKAKKQTQTENADSQWIHEAGQRITINVKEIKCLTSYFTQFGTTYIYKFVSSENNVYIWKTAKVIENVQKITGTVKELSEYNGVKQTVLTRCKIF